MNLPAGSLFFSICDATIIAPAFIIGLCGNPCLFKTKALKKKAADHNEEYGDDPKKKLTNRNYLAVSYHRGLAAYHGSPESVRPSVGSAAQWAMGRVNGLLYALRTGKFRRRPYDTDLLPEEHPLKDAEDDKEQKHLIFGWKDLELAPKDQDWGFTKTSEQLGEV